jgi:hypothetical protein
MRTPVALAVTGLVLLWSATASAQLLPPGPLSGSHSKLEGGEQCQKCHSEARKVSADRCLSCHTALGARIRAGAGLHGRNYAGKACSSCHVEHRGRGAGLVRWPGGAAKSLDHGLTGWALLGRHRELACGSCHKARNSTGGASYLGQRSACVACHQDSHEGRYGQSCETCHSATAWNKAEVKQFNHDLARFRLKGKHVDVACAKCHGTPPRYRGLKSGSCTDCHEKSPHKGADYAVCESCHMDVGWKQMELVKRNHPGASLVNGHAEVACTKCHDTGLAAPPTRGAKCVSCHGVVHEANFGQTCERCHANVRWRGIPRKVALEAHELTDFPLRENHAKTDCDNCHLPRLRREDRWRNLQFGGCKNCHDDRHGGEFAAREGGECGRCHEEKGFFPTTFGLEQHATTAFPLEGRHLAVPCARCHGETRPRLDLRVAGRRCEDCHQSPHGDQFAAEMAAGGCARCHSTIGWDTPNIAHETWPRTGAHARTKCTACHSPTAEDRRAGKGASYRGIPRNCEGCHEDPHAGQFRLGDPVRTCDSCHGTEQYEISDFDHEERTGYALKGRHRELECARCHRTEKLPGGREVTRWRLGYRNCRSCHADPHGSGGTGKRTPRGDGGAR